MDQRLERHPLGYWKVRDIPDNTALKKFYADRYYQTNQGHYRSSYTEAQINWFNMRIARIAAAVAGVNGGKKGTLLDVGCGEGFALNWFSKNGWKVKGLDYSTAGISAIHPHMLPFLTAGDVMENLRDLGDSNLHFDLVWLTNVLEHVPDPQDLLISLKKVVSDKGVAVVSVPNDGTHWQEFLYKSQMITERNWITIPDHLAYFDKDSLRNTAESAGWTCKHLFSDFPIDWFLANSHSNYYLDRTKGSTAHAARITIDAALDKCPIEDVNRFYEAMADVGMGRVLTAILV